MAIILNGKHLAETWLEKQSFYAREQVASKGNATPKLAIVRVGNDTSSKLYVNKKAISCHRIGITAAVSELGEQTTQSDLNNLLSTLSQDTGVHGILLQLPLPRHLDAGQAFEHIAPQKDVDGLTSHNRGMLMQSASNAMLPCTPMGVMALLKHYNISLAGKHVCVVGRSILVGKPLALLCLEQNATVTVCHSKTPNLGEITRSCDVVISAVGAAGLIKADMIKKGAVVVDVGINRTLQGKLCGDVQFEQVSQVASHITPVPGGVGPMTVAMLMQNVLTAYAKQNGLDLPN